jgi:hypothetical protein
MNRALEALPDERIRGEIGKLMAHTMALHAQGVAQTGSLYGGSLVDRPWFPWVATSVAMLAGAGLAAFGSWLY